jgi:hypothetical protein
LGRTVILEVAMWADLGAGIAIVNGSPEFMPAPIMAFRGLRYLLGSRLRDGNAPWAAASFSRLVQEHMQCRIHRIVEDA